MSLNTRMYIEFKTLKYTVIFAIALYSRSSQGTVEIDLPSGKTILGVMQ